MWALTRVRRCLSRARNRARRRRCRWPLAAQGQASRKGVPGSECWRPCKNDRSEVRCFNMIRPHTNSHFGERGSGTVFADLSYGKPLETASSLRWDDGTCRTGCSTAGGIAHERERRDFCPVQATLRLSCSGAAAGAPRPRAAEGGRACRRSPRRHGLAPRFPPDPGSRRLSPPRLGRADAPRRFIYTFRGSWLTISTKIYPDGGGSAYIRHHWAIRRADRGRWPPAGASTPMLDSPGATGGSLAPPRRSPASAQLKVSDIRQGDQG
jgi:hypothetical protein